MKRIILLSIILLNILTVSSQTTKRDKIVELIDLIQTDKRIEMLMDEMLNSILTENSIDDSIFWNKYKERFQELYYKSMKGDLINLYDNHLSMEQVDHVHDFYASELGQSCLRSMEKLMIEAMNIGSKYGEIIAEEIFKEDSARKESFSDKLYNTEYSGCLDFHQGTFKLIINDSTEYIYKRKGDKQVETFGKGKSVYDIKWVNECKYELVLKETNNPYMEKQIGLQMTVNIYKSEGYTYKYYYGFKGDENVYEGELTKVE